MGTSSQESHVAEDILIWMLIKRGSGDKQDKRVGKGREEKVRRKQKMAVATQYDGVIEVLVTQPEQSTANFGCLIADNKVTLSSYIGRNNNKVKKYTETLPKRGQHKQKHKQIHFKHQTCLETYPVD